MHDAADVLSLDRVHAHGLAVLLNSTGPVLPDPLTLRNAEFALLRTLPEHGEGIEKTTTHLIHTVSPALNRSILSSNYYGFVTRGQTLASRFGEYVAFDQNPAVHLPDQTIASGQSSLYVDESLPGGREFLS